MGSRMKVVVGLVALVAVLAMFAGPGWSQDKPATPPAEPQFDEMMAKWVEVNAKGPEHEHLASFVGTWDAVSRMWPAPGAPVMESKAEAVFKTILDGRYLQQDYKCDAPEMAFDGLDLIGYDNLKKKYVSLWIDSMSTGMYLSLGSPDATGKVVTYYGFTDDPMTGERDKMSRTVWREESSDRLVLEMYEKPAGADEFKIMEIVYTRRK
ncbi:MAG: DUF1579 domain-containing protein [Phycisphaerae bacterium]